MKPETLPMRRSLRRDRFVEELTDPRTKSHADAARKAGYSPKSAKVTASLILTNANVSAEIEQRRAEISAHCRFDRQLVAGIIVDLALNSTSDAVKLAAAKTLGIYLGMEKPPAAPQPFTIEQSRQKCLDALQLLVAEGDTEAAAKAFLMRAYPEAAQWLG